MKTKLIALMLVTVTFQAQAQDASISAPGVEITQDRIIAPGVRIEADGISAPGVNIKAQTPSQLQIGGSLASYANASLAGMDFSHQNLAGANFTNATLNNANFTNANLSGANFANATLAGANLSGAVLMRASLVNVTLDGANLTDADLTEADLTNASLVGTWITGTRFTRAVLTNVDMSRAQRQTVKAVVPSPRPTYVDAGAISTALQATKKIDLTINFDFNSDKLTTDGEKQVAAVATALKGSDLEKARIRIEGHTDNVGSDTYNLDLSSRRAMRVLRALVDNHSVPETKLSAKGLGESKPIASNDADLGRAMNRRVTLVNLGPGN
ncbi:MAG: pentapeptide repeat-containing protein [Alphaproteobacteria bacterium]